MSPAWTRWRNYSSYELLSAFRMLKAPIDVDELAKSLEVHVHHVSNPGWEGAVRSSEERADVWVRAESPRQRKRFTLAHELGHLLLHPTGLEFRDAAPGTLDHPPTERQANAFAGALLMPRFLFQPLIYESNLTIEEMAARFVVAPVAVALRFEWVRSGREDP